MEQFEDVGPITAEEARNLSAITFFQEKMAILDNIYKAIRRVAKVGGKLVFVDISAIKTKGVEISVLEQLKEDGYTTTRASRELKIEW